jgi:hypothetical protein
VLHRLDTVVATDVTAFDAVAARHSLPSVR